VAVEVPIVGDVKRVLQALLPQIEAVDPAARAQYLAELATWRAESEKMPWHGSGAWRNGQLSADFVVGRIGEATGHDATIVADVGQNQMWTARYAGFKRPMSHISSGGLGTMGFGLPAALGAKVGRPDDSVVCLAGDGSLIMNVQEFATAVHHDIPVKVFLMNNGHFGLVRQWQGLFWPERYQSVEMGPSPDWPKLAEAFGWTGMQCTDKGDLRDQMRTALETDGPVLLDVHVTEDDNCYPMISAGAAARDMVG
jgi:acetolactate synthase-1/2/3 large subunit